MLSFLSNRINTDNTVRGFLDKKGGKDAIFYCKKYDNFFPHFCLTNPALHFWFTDEHNRFTM
jgi:hypothetical protein